MVEEPEREGLKDSPKTPSEIKHLIGLYESNLEELDSDNPENENLIDFYSVSIRILKRDLQDAQTIEAYKGNLKRASKAMFEIDQLDEDEPDKVFYGLKRKVEKYINKAELDIELKMKELEKQMEVVKIFQSTMRYNSPDLWFYHLREKTLEKGDY